MKLLPVLDLMRGHVVRGVGGIRSEYRPIQSQIASDSRPATVARALVSRFSCPHLYLADLDAIEGGEPDCEAYSQVAASGAKLIIDAGVGNIAAARFLRDYAQHHNWLSGIVVGLESVASAKLLSELCSIIGIERAVFSLDLRAGSPMTQVALWQNSTSRQIADEAMSAGFRRLIVLDVATVGKDQGPTTAPVCQELRAAYPSLEITSGGGVRSVADVRQLIAAGCDHVLVASALHDGRIDRYAEESTSPAGEVSKHTPLPQNNRR